MNFKRSEFQFLYDGGSNAPFLEEMLGSAVNTKTKSRINKKRREKT
jgi:hypothetical protein